MGEVVATVAEVLEAEDMGEDIVVRDLPMLKQMPGMDMEDMVDTDTVFTVERDQLMLTVVDSVEDLLDVDLEEEGMVDVVDIMARDLLILMPGNWRLWWIRWIWIWRICIRKVILLQGLKLPDGDANLFCIKCSRFVILPF